MANQEVPEAEIEEMNTMLSEVLGSDLMVPHGEKELIASTRSKWKKIGGSTWGGQAAP